MGGSCQLSSLGRPYQAYPPLHPALRPRKPTWVNYSSLVLWLPVRSGNAETFQRSEGGRRKRMGYVFLRLSPCSDFGSTRFLKQRPLVLSRWPSLYNSLPFRSCEYFFALLLWTQEGNWSIVLSLEYWTIPCCFPTLHLSPSSLNSPNLRMLQSSYWMFDYGSGAGFSNEEAAALQLILFWWVHLGMYPINLDFYLSSLFLIR